MNIYIDNIFGKYYKKSPLTLVDVGAAGGLDEKWDSAKKYLKVIGFEPDSRSHPELSKLYRGADFYTVLKTALYKEKTTLDLYLLRDERKSSIYEPNTELITKFSPKKAASINIENISKIEVDTLDNQLMDRNIEDVDFIKLDIQGAELDALKGSANVLKNSVFGVEIEVEFIEMYKGQPLFADADEFLRKNSFQLFDLQFFDWKREIGAELGGPRGQIIYGNALYLNTIEEFLRILSGISDKTAKKAKLLKAISICLLYGYLDYALALCGAAKAILDPGEYALVIQRIGEGSKLAQKLPRFFGRKKIANALYYLWNIFELAEYKGKYRFLKNTLGNLE